MDSEQIQFFPGVVKRATREFRSADLWKVPPHSLHRHPHFNVRIKDERYNAKVREYADSMKANGYYSDKPLAGYVAKEGN